MSTKAESAEKDKADHQSDLLVKLLLAGFVVMVLLVTVGAMVGFKSVTTATDQLDRRNVVIEYLSRDNQWDNCTQRLDREFSVAISDVIKASSMQDRSALHSAVVHLDSVRNQIDRIDEPTVCGPPPNSPKNPN